MRAVVDAAKISPYDLTTAHGGSTGKVYTPSENGRSSRATGAAAGSGRVIAARHLVRNVQSQRQEELDLNDEYPPPPYYAFQPDNHQETSEDDIDGSIEIIQMDSVPHPEQRGRAKHRDEPPPTPQQQKRRQHLSLSPLRIFSFRDRTAATTPVVGHQSGSLYSRSSPSIASLRGPGSTSFLKLPLSSPAHGSGKPDFLGLLKSKNKTEQHDTIQSWEFVIPPEDAPSLLSTLEAATSPSTPLSCTPSPTQLTFDTRPSLDLPAAGPARVPRPEKALQIPLPLSPIEARPVAPPPPTPTSSSPTQGRHHYPGRPLPRAPASTRYCVDSAYGPSDAFFHNLTAAHCPEELLIDFDGPVADPVSEQVQSSVEDQLRELMPGNSGSLLDRPAKAKDKRVARLQIPNP